MQETMEFIAIINRVTKVVRHLPQMAATLAVGFSKDRFRAQNWADTSRESWKARSTNTWGRKERTGRAILVDSGRLRRSIRVIHVDENSAIIGTDVPYARIHNEGYSGTVKQNVRAYSYSRYGKQKRGTGIYSIKTRKERTRTVRVKTGDIRVKAHTRTITQKIPRRQYIGQSALLNRRIERMMTNEIKNAITG